MARDCAVSDGVRKAETILSQESQIAQLRELIAECQAQIREDETNRRALHNTIQELKGLANMNTHTHTFKK